MQPGPHAVQRRCTHLTSSHTNKTKGSCSQFPTCSHLLQLLLKFCYAQHQLFIALPQLAVLLLLLMKPSLPSDVAWVLAANFAQLLPHRIAALRASKHKTAAALLLSNMGALHHALPGVGICTSKRRTRARASSTPCKQPCKLERINCPHLAKFQVPVVLIVGQGSHVLTEHVGAVQGERLQPRDPGRIRVGPWTTSAQSAGSADRG